MSAAAQSPQEEARLLEDALGIVRQQAASMKKCLVPGKLMDALKCSSTLVSELRTGSLTPKQYYELYMAVFDALRHLSVHLKESHPVNHLADLYELVQYAGNIIPRLYLMVTVGTVYMSIPDAPVKEVMKDMMEMSRGVQQPMRGLFLRYYLMGQARDNLPTGTGDGPEGNINDSISFVLTNFVEMNKLWVRLQHQGHSREREKRVEERKQLQQLVGNNLVRLSQLVDLDSYKNMILTPLLEQVVQCRDVLAQEYLCEIITQVFPDEYHLHTLDPFLAALSRLNPSTNVKAIVSGVMDRLSSYAVRETKPDPLDERIKKEKVGIERLHKIQEYQKNREAEMARAAAAKAAEPEDKSRAQEMDASEPNGHPEDAAEASAPAEDGETDGANVSSAANALTPSGPDLPEAVGPKGIPEDIKLFEIFFNQVVHLIQAQGLGIGDTIPLLVSLSNLAIKIYPYELNYYDQILSFARQKVSENANSPDLHSSHCQVALMNLLLVGIHGYTSIFTTFILPNFIPLLQSQPYATRRSIARVILVENIFKNNVQITTQDDADKILECLKVLISEGFQQVQGYPTAERKKAGAETEDTLEEQSLLARFVHNFNNENNDTQLKLLQTVKKAYEAGGDRIKLTTPAIVNEAIKLARRFKKREHFDDNWADQSKVLFRFVHAALSTLYTRTGSADLCFRLFVMSGQIADQCELEEIAYENFAQALTLYEESISDSRAQFQALCILIGALQPTRNFSKENYDTLITKVALHGNKLVKKPDQARAICYASHLWWATEIPAREEDDGKTKDGKLLYRDGKRVLECLQRALRVADACMDTAVSVELFVEILNRYIYYYERGVESITIKYINGLIELIYQYLNNLEAGTGDHPRRYFERTLDFIRSREWEGIVTEAAK